MPTIILTATAFEQQILRDQLTHPAQQNVAHNTWTRGILGNRPIVLIEAGIGLQSDATVNFVTGKGLAQPTYADLEIDSPYNTYKYRGLTPGPISNPSIETIEAVIYPTTNEYYYFLTTPEGEAIYSKTYDEHLQNKYKYLD